MQWQPRVTQAPAVVGAFYFFSHTNKFTNQPPIPVAVLNLVPSVMEIFFCLRIRKLTTAVAASAADAWLVIREN